MWSSGAGGRAVSAINAGIYSLVAYRLAFLKTPTARLLSHIRTSAFEMSLVLNNDEPPGLIWIVMHNSGWQLLPQFLEICLEFIHSASPKVSPYKRWRYCVTIGSTRCRRNGISRGGEACASYRVHVISYMSNKHMPL